MSSQKGPVAGPSEAKSLAPLPNANKYSQIVTRFAPNPDFVLHIGSLRAVFLSHDYARMYKGKFILRFEDTDPRLKKSVVEYYGQIEKDVKWLGCEYDEKYIMSDRIPIYYEYAEKALGQGFAFVCTCEPDQFKAIIESGRACPHRSKSPAENLESWHKMLSGQLKEGEAVVRVKTETTHPNPAVRDWPAFRIIDPEKYPHPRVGSEYRVWPLYNFSAAVDDHLMGVTHIIRGKEHLTNAVRQTFLYKHMGWSYPEAIEYGRLKMIGFKLSKSEMVKELEEGLVDGFDDPRLPTVASLRRRGYSPEALRKVVHEMGARPVDATLSWDNINATNRKEIDKLAHRYNFIPNPVPMDVSQVSQFFEAHLPLHPELPDLGNRTLKVVPRDGVARIWLSGSDLQVFEKAKVVRLMELFNVEIHSTNPDLVKATFHSQEYAKARELKAPLIQWLPDEQHISCEVVMPDASETKGFGETNLLRERVGSIIQMVRFGFGRIDSKEEPLTVYFAHK
jgi:glutamyl-tRNA synthetase